MISVTTVIEYVFCSRFTYFEHVMGLAQYEEKRGTVDAGKKHHTRHEKTNKSFIPAEYKGVKISSQKLYSKKHNFVGVIDHAIIGSNQVTIIERKYSQYDTIYPTVKVQLGLLSILVEENLNKPCNTAIVIFTKNGKHNKIKVDINDKMRSFALQMLTETLGVIDSGLMPKESYDLRCNDCCYRKICDVGSIKY